MKTYIWILSVVVVTMGAGQGIAAVRNSTAPTIHQPIYVFQAYGGHSGNAAGLNAAYSFRGYAGQSGAVITSVPGVLSIDPGHVDLNGNGILDPSNETWRNYVLAAQRNVSYTIKNVTMKKVSPSVIQCNDVFPAKTILQQGTAKIRLWWPTLYEAPGTTWTLTILYGTSVAWDDDGSGPNGADYVHTEVWQWSVDASPSSMKHVLETFHELPFGTGQVPLISDEALYRQLLDYLALVQSYISMSDYAEGGLTLGDFEMTVADACVATAPLRPDPAGSELGIANTEENPACCKLLVDSEFVGFKYGIYQSGK